MSYVWINHSVFSLSQFISYLLTLTTLICCRYLQACRDRDLTHSVREGVDTLLMYLYRALNRVDDMERLASSENSCVVVCIIAPFSLRNWNFHLWTGLTCLYTSFI